MKTIIGLSTAALLCLMSPSCPGAIEMHLFDNSAQPVTIPDGDLIGVSISGQVESIFSSIASVSVTLDLAGRGPAGGWNGDIYATLFHGGEMVVLVNRPGVTGSNPSGYGDSGMSVTFSDAGLHKINTYRQYLPGGENTRLAGTLGGTWLPDGRVVDPEDVSSLTPDSTYPVTSLESFKGMDPDGSWTLFLADCDYGGLSEVSGWSLRFEGPPSVPELLNTAVALLVVLVCFVLIAPRPRLVPVRASKKPEQE